MSLSPHLAGIRALVGPTLLTLPGVAVAVVDDGELLLLRHADTGWWVLPGGMVEPEEHPADAAVRETEEETGVRVTVERIVAVQGGPGHRIRYRNGDEVAYVTTVFLARTVGGQLRPDGVEALELRRVPLDALAEVDGLAPWLAELVPALIGGEPSAWFHAPSAG